MKPFRKIGINEVTVTQPTSSALAMALADSDEHAAFLVNSECHDFTQGDGKFKRKGIRGYLPTESNIFEGGGDTGFLRGRTRPSHPIRFCVY